MENKLNEKFVKVMKESLATNLNLANYLIDTLKINREAVYRRLRGDVSFTLYEVAEIALNLNISLDRIIGNNDTTDASINLNLIKSPDSLIKYNTILNRYLSIINLMRNDSCMTLYSASNILPFIFYAKKENIIKFMSCRWLHQTNRLNNCHSLNDITVPKELLDLHFIVANEILSIPKIIYIWDSNIFFSIVEELKFFSDLKLVSKEDVANIKKELLEILDSMENILAFGNYKNSNEIQVYLCNIPMEAAYTYMETANSQICMIRVFAINLLETKHYDMCKLQREWILSLKRYSTLITQSNEMERLIFLDKQHEYINLL